MIQEAAHPEAHIIFGANVDDTLDEQIWVTVDRDPLRRPRPSRRRQLDRRPASRSPARRSRRAAEREGGRTRVARATRPARASSASTSPSSSRTRPRERLWPAAAVAAGHPETAEAGAWALREGGNAVDAAVAAVCASFVAESPLTGLGAGGYMLVHGPGR